MTEKEKDEKYLNFLRQKSNEELFQITADILIKFKLYDRLIKLIDLELERREREEVNHAAPQS